MWEKMHHRWAVGSLVEHFVPQTNAEIVHQKVNKPTFGYMANCQETARKCRVKKYFKIELT